MEMLNEFTKDAGRQQNIGILKLIEQMPDIVSAHNKIYFKD